MEIPWPAWFLPYHPAHAVRSYRAWRRRRRLGLPPLSTPQVTSIPDVDRDNFARSGYTPQPVMVLPYARQSLDYTAEDELLDLDDPAISVDQAGVFEWRDAARNVQHHPVAIAQYALAALGGYDRTGDEQYLRRALANARRLVRHAERDADGRLWFPYGFPHRYYDVTMPVPWWSSMAQGHALSLFSRLHRALPEQQEWLTAANDTFASFSGWRALGQPWITTIDAEGMLWFEEYAGDVEPLLVVNGHIFALYGLYDYAQLTQNPLAIDYFDGGATTVLHYVDRFRVPGDVSYYCVRSGYCQRPEWQNAAYHPLHIRQLRTLAEMTGDGAFELAARALEDDARLSAS